MRLYLMRHGIAVAADDPSIQQDSDRPLTSKGIKRMRRIAQGVRRLKIPFDGILTSPLPRARQTADIVAAALGMESRIEEISGLTPESTVEHLLFGLARYQDREHLLMIGHEPLLGSFACHLLSGGRGCLGEIVFKKGSICCLESDGALGSGPARVHWHLAPRQLRRLG